MTNPRQPDIATNEALRELLAYEPDTGILRWAKAMQGRRVGSLAGSVTERGYRTVRVGKVVYKAHRLAWFLAHGQWPSLFLDHINGNRQDNRLCNLREATGTQNNMNRKSPGGRLKGASKTPSNRWSAFIGFKGRKIYLGTFDTAEQASAAYMAKSRELYGEFARAA